MLINSFYPQNSDHRLPQDHHDRPPAPPASVRLPADHPVQRVAIHQVHVHDRGMQAHSPPGSFCDTLVGHCLK